MIRAHRFSAAAQDDSSLVSGWNIAPNLSCILQLLPGASSCGALLFDEDNVLVASGAALVGAEQPCFLLPQAGRAVKMVDADLGWHLLITTTGTESQRTIRVNPTVDLPDEIHPVYGDNGMALARATAAIDAATHYSEDITATCPNRLGAGLGAVVTVPVDNVALTGQSESITWNGTPNGASEQAVIRRHIAIAPDAYVAPLPPPTVANDSASIYIGGSTSGNVLANDDSGLTVVAVNGLPVNVGEPVAGTNGGTFTINADGLWTFDSDGITGDVVTVASYHASNGTAEALAYISIAVAPMTIEFVGYAVGSSATGAAFTINLPAGVLPGDLVIAVQSLVRPADYPVGVSNPVDYITVANQYSNDSNDINSYVGYKIMPDQVDASLEFLPSGSSSYANTGVVTVWRNVDPSQPMDVAPVLAQGINSGTPNPPAITPISDGAVIVLVGGGMSQNCWAIITPENHENVVHVCKDCGTSVHSIVSSVEWDGLGVYDCPVYTRPTNSSEEGQDPYKAWTAVSLALRPA